MLTMYGFIIFPIGSSRLLYYLIESGRVIQIVTVNVWGTSKFCSDVLRREIPMAWGTTTDS